MPRPSQARRQEARGKRQQVSGNASPFHSSSPSHSVLPAPRSPLPLASAPCLSPPASCLFPLASCLLPLASCPLLSPPRQMLNQILSNHTGKSLEVIAKDTDRDFFLGAEQAKEYGLVDDILAKPPSDDDDTDKP